MPEHKRHYYVPRCYLKAFSLNKAGAAVNLYNISADRSIRSASVKGQCAKNYLYGTSPDLEHALATIEGEYARVLKVIQHGEAQLSDADLDLLRAFAFLQRSRTDMALQRTRMLHDGMHKQIFHGRPVEPEEIDLSDRAMMIASMKAHFDARRYFEDLKVCTLINKTSLQFITSDDPAVFVNRFHAQRLKRTTFGLSSSGALLFLPLTPSHMLVCYDGGVYTIPSKRNGYATITVENDVHALNELQYLMASENVYFLSWSDRVSIEEAFHSVAPNRPRSWCTFTTLVPDGVSRMGTRYRKATEEERRTALRAIIATSMNYPVPSIWVSNLKYRNPIRTYSDGSAVGHVRKKAWLTSRP